MRSTCVSSSTRSGRQPLAQASGRLLSGRPGPRHYPGTLLHQYADKTNNAAGPLSWHASTSPTPRNTPCSPPCSRRVHVNASAPAAELHAGTDDTAPGGSDSSHLDPALMRMGISADGARLVDWVCSHGGYVHPNLLVVDATPICGCRGVVASHAITLSDLDDAPLIVVPERLYLTLDRARQLLQQVSKVAAAPGAVSKVASAPGAMSKGGGPRGVPGGVVELGLLLAHERGKGPDSFWYPYINALPAAPPCAWLLPPAQLDQQLQRLGPAAAGWEKEAQAVGAAVRAQVAKAVEVYGAALGVSQEGVVWAVAQVMSRAWGSGSDLGMAPLIDMVNHRRGADVPGGWKDQETGDEMAFITSTLDNVPLPLAPGEELFVSYMSSCSPLTTFTNFGFVPPELRVQLGQ